MFDFHHHYRHFACSEIRRKIQKNKVITDAYGSFNTTHVLFLLSVQEIISYVI